MDRKETEKNCEENVNSMRCKYLEIQPSEYIPGCRWTEAIIDDTFDWNYCPGCGKRIDKVYVPDINVGNKSGID